MHEAVGVLSREKTKTSFTDEARLFTALLLSDSSRSKFLSLDESFKRTFQKNYISNHEANKINFNVDYKLPRKRRDKKLFEELKQELKSWEVRARGVEWLKPAPC